MSIAAVRVSGDFHARSSRKTRLLATTALIAALSVVSVPAFAQTWDGETNKNFLVGSNWDGNVAPAAGGAVVLDDGALANQPILNAGNAAVVDTVAVSAGTLRVLGNLSANSGVTVTGGVVRVGAAGSISGDAQTSGAGRLLLDGSLTGNVTNGGVLSVFATSVVVGDVTSSGTGTNAGRITGTLGVTGGTFGNSGVVDGATSVSGGVLSLDAGSNLADASTLTVSGTGTLTVNAADTVRAVNLTGGTIEGAATLTTTTFAQSGGELAGTVSATGAKTLSGGTISGVLTGAGVVTVQTGTTTVSGTIDSDVRVADSGTLRLENSNAVAGTIRTTGSVISYANGVNEASAIIITSNTTQLEVLGADAAEQSGAIGQNGAARPLEKIGTGTLLLSGPNTYTGATTVTAGTLNVSGGAALSNTAAVNVAAGATLGVLADERVGALAGAGNVALTGTLTTGNATDSAFSGVASGAGGLTKLGTGTFTLSNANTYAGATTVNAGTLDVTGSIASAVVTLNGGATLEVDGTSLADTAAVTLNNASNLTLSGSERIGSLAGASPNATVTLGANTLTTGDAGDTTFAGNIGGTGGVTKEGAGTFTLSRANAYTGATTVNAGVLDITGSVASAVVTVNGGSVRVDGASLANTAAVTLNGTGNLTLTGSEVIGSLASGSVTSTVTLGANTLTTGAAGNTSFAGVIGGTGGVTKQGAGTFTLSGTNTYTGLTQVNAGTLEVTGSVAGNVTIADAGRLRIGNSNAIGGSITTTGSVISYANGVTEASAVIVNSNTTQLEVLAADAATQSGVISELGGARPVEKIGTGTLTLSGANTFTGDLVISGGTLAVSGGAALNNAVEVIVGAAGTFRVDASEDIGALTSASATAAVAIGANDLTIVGAQNTTYAGTLAGTGLLVNSGSARLELTGNGAAFTGSLGADGLGSEIAITGAGQVNASVIGAGVGATLSTDGGAILAANAVLAAEGQVTFTGSETVGTVTNDTGTAIANGSITLTGAGTILTVSGNPNALNPGNFNGTNGTINGTGTLNIQGGVFNVGATGNVQTATTVSEFAALVNNGTMAGVSNAGNLLNAGSAGALINTGAGNGTNSGTLASLTHNSTGLFINQGAVTGNTTVSNGTLRLEGASNLGDAATLQVTGGVVNSTVADTIGTLDADGGILNLSANLTAGTLSGDAAGRIVGVAASTLNVGGSNASSAFNGQINGLAALTKTGTGVLTLTGVNGYTGATSVTGGTLAVTGTLASTAIGVGAAGTLTTDGGVLAAGAQIVNAGAVVLGGSESIASINDGGTVTLTAGTLTLNAGASVISGAVSGAGGLTVAGTSATELTAVNSYAGATDVTGTGSLSVTGAGTLASTDIETAGTGAFATDGGALTTATQIANAGSVTFSGSESISRLNGAGAVALTAGTLTLNSGASSITGVVSGAGGLTVAGGATTLSAANTFTGLTTVQAGALSLTGSVGGAANVTGGAFSITGGTVGGATTNNGGIINAANATFTGGLTNTTGTVNVTGVNTGNVSNAALIVADGNASFAGTLANTGVVDLDDGATGDVFTVSAAGANAGTFLMDLNLNTGTADRIAVTGGGVSAAVLDFNIPAGRTFVGGPITVFSGAAAGSLAGFVSADLPDVSGIIYALGQTGDEIQVVSLVNPAVSGIAAASAVTQSLIATVVNRPTSPFVSGLAAEETCSSGGYARATGGKATAAGTSVSNGIAVTTDVSATYGGIQGGYDFGCFDGRYANGWDGAIGIMGGVNFGSTEQDVFANPLDKTSAITGTSGSDFNQSYLGVYVAASKDKFSGDVQLRFDRTEFELSEIDNPATPGSALVGFDKAKFDTRTSTLGARFNYRIDLNEANGISLVPTIGFTHSRTSGDTVVWDGGNQSLRLEPYSSTVGFVGATLTRTKVAPSGTAATTLFASGNYYQDFTGDRDSTYVNIAEGVNQPIILENIGGFGEASIGVNYVKVLEGTGSAGAKQFNANIRADARFGGNVSEAYSLTAQVRLSF